MDERSLEVIQSHDLVPGTNIFRMEHLLAGQLTESSIAMYKRDVADYTDFAEQSDYDALDPITLAKWRDHLSLETYMSPHTINRMMSAVKRLVKEAALRKMIDTGLRVAFADVPGVKVKALKSRLKQHSRTRIAPEDMRRLCNAPDTSTDIGARDAAILALLASSGIRASEAATLTLSQIEKRGRGYVVKVCGKTDTEYRDAHLSPEAYRLINEWVQRRPTLSNFIFTSFSTRGRLPSCEHLSEAAVWSIVRHYANQCGLQYVKPHDFRRFVGTQLAKKDIRKARLALGHKSIEVTAKHYVLDELEVGLTDELY